MTKSSLRSHSKAFLSIFIIGFVLFIFNLPFIFKEPFSHLKHIVEKGISDAMDKELSIEEIGFLPYGELVLHNVNLYDRTRDVYYGSVKECRIRFRLLPLVIDKSIVITKITLKEPVFFPPAKDLRILQDKTEAVNGYKLELSRNFLLKIESGRAVLTDSDLTLNEIGFNLWIKLREGDKFYSEGYIDLAKYRLKDYVLNDLFFFEFINKIGYQLNASFDDNRLLVKGLLLDFGHFKIGAVGAIENYDTDPVVNLKLILKELAFSEKLSLGSRLLMTSIRNLIVYIKGAINEPHLSVSLDSLRSRFGYLPSILKIDNFYCDLRLSKEELLIEECSCFLNNFPVGIRCELRNLTSAQIYLEIISYPGQIPSLKPFNPFNFEFSFSGYKEEDVLKGEMSFQIEKLISSHPRRGYNLKLAVMDLSCGFLDSIIAEKTIACLLLQAEDIVYEIDAGGGAMKLDFEELMSLLYPDGHKFHLADFNVSGYEGFLNGKGFLDFKGLPPQFFLDFEFDKFDIAKMIDLSHLDYELTGVLSGRGILDSQAFSCLIGRASVSQGYIRNLELLELISDFLGVDSLKDIYFENCSSNFSFSILGKEIDLHDISLSSEDIYLDANLKFTERQKIKGDILLSLSTALLSESFKLRMLFLLMGERFPYADFGFEIGGFLKNPHLKWRDTRFKKKVMRYLSEKDQRLLEKTLEEAIQPLLENR